MANARVKINVEFDFEDDFTNEREVEYLLEQVIRDIRETTVGTYRATGISVEIDDIEITSIPCDRCGELYEEYALQELSDYGSKLFCSECYDLWYHLLEEIRNDHEEMIMQETREKFEEEGNL